MDIMDIDARCDFSFVIISSVKRKHIKCSYKKLLSSGSLSLSGLYQWHPFRPFSAHFGALGQIRGHVWYKRQVTVPESHFYHKKIKYGAATKYSGNRCVDSFVR